MSTCFLFFHISSINSHFCGKVWHAFISMLYCTKLEEFFLHSHSYLLWETFHRHFYDKNPTKQFHNLCSAGFLPVFSSKTIMFFYILFPFLQMESKTSLSYWNHMTFSIYLSLFIRKKWINYVYIPDYKKVFLQCDL